MMALAQPDLMIRRQGPRGAQDEFILAAIAPNRRRLASLVPPDQVLCIA
jgi:hypothetical protein